MKALAARITLLCLTASGCIAHPVGVDADDDPEPAAAAGGAESAPSPEVGVETAENPPPAAAETAPDETPAEPEPEPEPEPAPPACDASPYEVHRPESATRIGDALFIGLEDGRVLRSTLGDRQLSWPYDVPALAGVEMDRGLARLRPLASDASGPLVRMVRRGNVGRVEILAPDAQGDPAPVSVAEYVDAAEDFAVAGGRIYFCAGETLVALDPTDASRPVAPGFDPSPCQAADGHVAGRGSLGRFTHGHGNLVPEFAVHRLHEAGPAGEIALGFNPGGVHAYGDIVGLFLGEKRGVVDVRNTHNFFVLDLAGDTGGRINDGRMDVPDGARLVSLEGDQAWFASADDEALLAYDLAMPGAPAARSTRWPLFVNAELARTRAETPRVLFADAELLVLRGTDGLLSVWSTDEGTRWAQTIEDCGAP